MCFYPLSDCRMLFEDTLILKSECRQVQVMYLMRLSDSVIKSLYLDRTLDYKRKIDLLNENFNLYNSIFSNYS